MDLQYQLDIQQAAGKVYQAFATEEGIKGWWCTHSTVGTQVGEAIHLSFNYGGNVVHMDFTLEEAGPNKVSWRCTGNGNPAWIGSRILFEVEQQGDRTHFQLTHDSWDQQWAGSPPYENTVNGWHPFLDSLKAYCETGTGTPGGL